MERRKEISIDRSSGKDLQPKTRDEGLIFFNEVESQTPEKYKAVCNMTNGC